MKKIYVLTNWSNSKIALSFDKGNTIYKEIVVDNKSKKSIIEKLILNNEYNSDFNKLIFI